MAKSKYLEAQNFELYAKDDKWLRVTVRDDDGRPVDLTGAAVTWSVAASEGGSPIVTLTSPTDIDVSDPLSGVFLVKIEDTDAAGLPAGRYYHECIVIDGGGLRTTVFFGFVDIRAPIIA